MRIAQRGGAGLIGRASGSRFPAKGVMTGNHEMHKVSRHFKNAETYIAEGAECRCAPKARSVGSGSIDPARQHHAMNRLPVSLRIPRAFPGMKKLRLRTTPVLLLWNGGAGSSMSNNDFPGRKATVVTSSPSSNGRGYHSPPGLYRPLRNSRRRNCKWGSNARLNGADPARAPPPPR